MRPRRLVLAASFGLLGLLQLVAVPVLAEPRYNHRGRVSLGGRAGWYRGGEAADALVRGIGLSSRYQFHRRIGVESSIGFFQPDDPQTCNCSLDIQVMPVDLNLFGFLFPDSPFSVYGLAGALFEMTDVDVRDDPGDRFAYDTRLYQRFGVQGGVGAEISFGARFAVTADWRYIYYLSGPIPDPVGSALAGYNTVHFTVGLNYFFF